MLRRLLFVLAGVALAAMLAPTRAADGDISGNWQLSTVAAGGESTACILKVETKDGKPSAIVVFSPTGIVKAKVTDFRVTDTTVSVTVAQTRLLKDQKGKEREFTTETAFVGTRGKDPKVVFGSTGDDRFRTRAKLTATDKEKLTPAEMSTKADLPKPMAEAQQLNAKAAQAQLKMLQEKDAAKRKELQKEFTEVAKEANEKLPVLFREVTNKHADSPAAFDAALNLLRAARAKGAEKLTADEAEKLVKLAQKHADPYGPLFVGVTFTQVASALTAADLGAAAVAAVEPSAKALKDDQPVEFRYEVLDAYRAALEKAGKGDAAKALAPQLAKLDTAMDAEYLKGPFKTTPYAGRKDKSANRVAVMELFTGAQCPPCVAADLGFDGLLKSYKPTDVVLIQYHVHIPGPDPLTIPDAVARFDYYRNEFPDEVRGAPSTVFNGRPQAGGGGGKAAGEGKYKEYTGIIDALLEKSADVKVGGKATRTGDKIDLAVEVTGSDGADMKLRLLVVEDVVKYIGGNRVRFHHHVVRAMPGGAAGVAITDKAFKHTASTDLAEVRKDLTKYLDEFAKARPFPKSDRPMDMKDLKVIALVQNDKTKEIVQAVQIEIEGKVAGGR
jgi:hypothetical protein